MKNKEHLEGEQEFHNKIFAGGERASHDRRYYSINHRIIKTFDSYIFNNPKDKVVLEYGCGMAENNRLVKLVQQGAIGFGIDISDFAIDHLSKSAKKEKINVNYQIMNAESMTFPANEFDMIYGTGILHHLDLIKSYPSIANALKKTGTAIFIEPLGHNFLINRFRKKTPDLRTENEHPLLICNFEEAKRYFNKVEVHYFYLTTLVLPILLKFKAPKNIVDFFDWVDRVIFRACPSLKKYSWQALIILSDPK